MDPNECIWLAIEAVNEGRSPAQHLADYAAWRSSGGFPAETGLLEQLMAAQSGQLTCRGLIEDLDAIADAERTGFGGTPSLTIANSIGLRRMLGDVLRQGGSALEFATHAKVIRQEAVNARQHTEDQTEYIDITPTREGFANIAKALEQSGVDIPQDLTDYLSATDRKETKQ